MPAIILAVVDDIFFLAKIQEAARHLGDVTVEPAAPDALQEKLAGNAAHAVVVDLNHRSGKAIAVLEQIRNHPSTGSIPVVAFVSHVQTDLVQAARAAGCGRVMARSAFSQQLPVLLRELSKADND
ncbi:MAG TPA: response regulator [Terriglobia bacterium]|nr:response regulator [Terriglobia bacterium]